MTATQNYGNIISSTPILSADPNVKEDVMTDQQKITILYCRLSNEDSQDRESNSIQNQREFLTRYARDHGYTNLKVLVDDGYTGTNFQRPGVQEGFELVKQGLVGCWLCKDLSRFGRDYLTVGQYTDIIFPSYDVRFIAVNDGVDSQRGDGEGFAAIRNLFNEWYPRDTSKKVRTSLRQRGTSGKHLGKPPYGYRCDPNDKDRWILDEDAAPIVKRPAQHAPQPAAVLLRQGLQQHKGREQNRQEPAAAAHKPHDLSARRRERKRQQQGKAEAQQRQSKIRRARPVLRHNEQPPDAQIQVDGMRHGKHRHIARNAMARQQDIEEYDVQNGCQRVIAHAAQLLGEALEHAVDNGIEIEHQHHRRKNAQVAPRIRAVIDTLAQLLRADEEEARHGCGKQYGHADTLPAQVTHTQAAPHGPAA